MARGHQLGHSEFPLRLQEVLKVEEANQQPFVSPIPPLAERQLLPLIPSDGCTFSLHDQSHLRLEDALLNGTLSGGGASGSTWLQCHSTYSL